MTRVMSVRRTPRAFRVTTLLSIAAAATIVACGGSTEPKKDVTPASITPSTTDTLRGQAASQLNTALTVTVKNAAGQPIDSALVTFAVVSGGGSVAAPSVRTDSLGRATNTWTLGQTAGVQTMTASAGALPAVTFVAIASAQAASTIAKVAGDAQSAVAGATVAIRPAVKIADQFGNPVPNATVTFAIASGGGQVTGGSATTDATGVATVGSWKLGNTAGANSLTATVQGVAPVTFTATGIVGSVAQLRITNTAPTLNSGQTFKFTVQALDANNNIVANPAVTFSSSNTGVATVDNSGTVTGVGAGTSTITAASGAVTATQDVNVLGHPAQTTVGNVALGSRIRDVSLVGTIAYAALSSSQSVAAVSLTSVTSLWATNLGAPVIGAAGNSTNTIVTAATSGSTAQFFFVNPGTHAAIDSLVLSGSAVRMAMTSTGTRALVDENNFQLEVVDVPNHAIISQLPLPGTVTALKVARGDTVAYAATTLGVVYELNALTGVVRRQFQPSSTVVDLDISADGKTLFVADGTSIVTMVRLATGGLSGPVDFGAPVSGVAVTPDNKQLWASTGNTLVAAPASGNTFDTSLTTGRVTVTGANLTKIYFTRLGDLAVVIDDSGNQLVVLK